MPRQRKGKRGRVFDHKSETAQRPQFPLFPEEHTQQIAKNLDQVKAGMSAIWKPSQPQPPTHAPVNGKGKKKRKSK